LLQFAPLPQTLGARDSGPLPTFVYHPDPVATRSIRRSSKACSVCRQRRGFEYTTSPYGKEDLNHVCPWCIADGSAAARGAQFVDDHPLIVAGVEPRVVAEVTRRTPGFASLQQEVWQVCCNDACAFMGALTADQIAKLPAAVRAEHELSDELIQDMRANKGRDSDLAVFGFRCLHCGQVKVWLDFS